MNAGIIGCGRISYKHASSYKLNNINCSILIDIDEKKCTKLLEFFGYSIPIRTTLNLININKLNFITISTDSGNHYSVCKDAINLGLNLVIEKPLTLDLEEADELSKLAVKNDVKIAVCHQNRFNISVIKLYQAIRTNKLGKLFYGVATIRWNRSQAYYDQADWRGQWRSDGGALMNQSIHNIDLLIWMMGSPVVEVFGYIDNKNHPSIEVEDMGVALLKFANGSFGIIESSMNTYPENFEETLSIFGENGTAVLGGKSVNKIVHWNVKDDSIDDLEKFNEEVDSVYGNGHIALYKDFIEAIEQDREPAITLQDGRNAVEVILAIYLSSFEKRPVQLPLPADTSTIMFEGKSFK
jgi:predicted dehydrogenase